MPENGFLNEHFFVFNIKRLDRGQFRLYYINNERMFRMYGCYERLLETFYEGYLRDEQRIKDLTQRSYKVIL